MGDAAPSLLDAIRAAQVPIGPRCSVGLLIESLTGQDLADFTTAMDDRSIHASTIGRVVRARGHTIGDDSLRRHRSKACGCFR